MPKTKRELTRADPIAWGSHMPAEQPDGVLSNGNFLDHKVAADLEQSRRANFQREWPLIPRELQRRIKPLALRSYPTREFIYVQGIIQGYSIARTAFNPVYATLLVQELQERAPWIMDEVRHARFSD